MKKCKYHHLHLIRQNKFSSVNLLYHTTFEPDSNLTVDDFLEECGIDLNTMTGFGWASILKQKVERFSNMNDDDFFDLYKKYKTK